MQKYLIKNIQVVNEGSITTCDVLFESGRIAKIAPTINLATSNAVEIDGEGKFLLPGCIDDQVHFREPGLTHKATIASEAKAAIAGGVTSFMEMPNTIPNALTHELLEDKYKIASATSLANFSFYMGTSNSNADEVLKTNERKNDVCGVKIFMGSSTGNMLVDNPGTLDRIFRESEMLIATHCEDEHIILSNFEKIQKEGRKLNASDHPVIRDEDACYSSSLYAIQIAKKYNTRLHILHISTAKELQLFTNMIPLKDKRITSEVCVHHLHFTSNDYEVLGNRIKCNPAIKSPDNRDALWEALLDNRLDVIATDHAPHTLAEKGLRLNDNNEYELLPEEGAAYEKAHAGLPLVQHSLQLMLYYYDRGKISMEKIVDKMCHAVAECFNVEGRGYLREGYYADAVIVDTRHSKLVERKNILYKCGWSPLEGFVFPSLITHTFVNGRLVYHDNYGNITWDESVKGERLKFNR